MSDPRDYAKEARRLTLLAEYYGPDGGPVCRDADTATACRIAAAVYERAAYHQEHLQDTCDQQTYGCLQAIIAAGRDEQARAEVAVPDAYATGGAPLAVPPSAAPSPDEARFLSAYVAHSLGDVEPLTREPGSPWSVTCSGCDETLTRDAASYAEAVRVHGQHVLSFVAPPPVAAPMPHECVTCGSRSARLYAYVCGDCVNAGLQRGASRQNDQALPEEETIARALSVVDGYGARLDQVSDKRAARYREEAKYLRNALDTLSGQPSLPPVSVDPEKIMEHDRDCATRGQWKSASYPFVGGSHDFGPCDCTRDARIRSALSGRPRKE